MSVNIDRIITKIFNTVTSHKLKGAGEYTRWLWQNDEGTRELGINPYGCADAANILYTIGKFPNTSEIREKFVNILQRFQDPQTGLFRENTHHFIHTTAHCTAALELFDVKPSYPLTELMKYANKNEIQNLLDNLPWEINPWNGSHQGAGIYAAMVLSGSVNSDWEEAYFEWLWENTDPATGFYGTGRIQNCTVPPFHNIGATFHYLFNVEYKHLPLRYPEKLIDTCLDIYKEQDEFTLRALAPSDVGFSIVDWVYCLTRASRQTPHRFNEIHEVLCEFAEKHIDFLDEVDEKTHDGFNDLHRLFGCVCGIAELQQALPGFIRSSKPLKLVLDRRPFI